MSVNNAVNDPRPPILDVGHRALRSVVTEAGVEYTDEGIRELLTPWPALEPHGDVVESFEQLGEEYTLGGLSNGDSDMREAVKPSLDGRYDAFVGQRGRVQTLL